MFRSVTVDSVAAASASAAEAEVLGSAIGSMGVDSTGPSTGSVPRVKTGLVGAGACAPAPGVEVIPW